MPKIDIVSGNGSAKQHGGTASFFEKLCHLAEPELQARAGEDADAAKLFRWDQDIVVSRAPGRLDVMGGIADYSGSLVLQMPIHEACHVALQMQHPAEGEAAVLSIMSLHADIEYRSPSFCTPLHHLFPGGTPLEYADAQQLFKQDKRSDWAAYIAGCLLVLAREMGISFGDRSVAILVSSEVPEGKGVSSSAAVEVAVMRALLGALGTSSSLDGRQLALLCQRVENLVVGAPCGIMDQMASALGEQDALLALLCQPAEVHGCVVLPVGARVWGVDSGARHSVGGSDYGAVRVGAFMGAAILGDHLGGRGAGLAGLPGGHLANLTPSELAGGLQGQLPEELGGREFLEAHGPHLDSVTKVDPDRRYAVRAAACHPVHEHARVRTFHQLLLAPHSEEQLSLMGELMLQSHESYSACRLGSEGTDRLVALVREHMSAARKAGHPPALYGAKITGGGSGGTVCILGSATLDAELAVEAIVVKYQAELGAPVKVFRGSSVGAVAFGHVVVRVSV